MEGLLPPRDIGPQGSRRPLCSWEDERPGGSGR